MKETFYFLDWVEEQGLNRKLWLKNMLPDYNSFTEDILEDHIEINLFNFDEVVPSENYIAYSFLWNKNILGCTNFEINTLDDIWMNYVRNNSDIYNFKLCPQHELLLFRKLNNTSILFEGD